MYRKWGYVVCRAGCHTQYCCKVNGRMTNDWVFHFPKREIGE